MPAFAVHTAHQQYLVTVERGLLARLGEFVPSRAGRIFVITTQDVWALHGGQVARGLASRNHEVLFFPGGEENKRLSALESLAEQMVARGGDRTSLVVAFGGGIAGDVAGFLAAVFMRGVPVIQVPTTLLAQVDAGIGGKTGVNLVAGKNLIGAFHQPLAVLIDPSVLSTLDGREYCAGLFEVIKHGIIRSPELFRLMSRHREAVLGRAPDAVDQMICESVRIKAEVVSADEKESGLRRILNFGHTFGHALEADTGYQRFLHGEAVAFGIRAAAHLSELAGRLAVPVRDEIARTVNLYGPLPSLAGIDPERLVARMQSDKKTLQGEIHFVLVEDIGKVSVAAGIDPPLVLAAARAALQ